ncbi:cytochrome c biogenesis CcdA family protein [Seleniivibrio woodruffii]|uniref:cytochrome c biogenesis CcdA family protein n=1 Tax=Seleniivibrio woodruffii TaxID=1078050 RepID=UPI00240A72D1|nr:cytochrome c biogenesis protein CcdA [Seleniivibrio woodruffii]
MDNVSFFTAFIAGVLSFLSPCVLPLLPGYLSFMSGESIETLTSGDKKSAKFKVFLGAVFFGLGFMLVFVLLGAGATKIGMFLKEYKLIIGRVAGVVIIVLGLHMLGVLRINKLMMHKKWNYSSKSGTPFFVNAFLLGVAFVFGWTPCIGPILAGILSLAAAKETVSSGILMLAVFGFGLWIPFLLSALAVGFVFSTVRKAGRVVMIVEKVSGVLLIIIGLLMATDSMNTLSVYLLKVFPFLLELNY